MPAIRTGNRIIDGLDQATAKSLLPHFERVALAQNVTLVDAGGVIEAVYFPTGGLISMVTALEDGATVEVGVIGREGIVGTPVLLGSDISPNRLLVQIEGPALKLPTSILLDAFEASRAFRGHLLRYTQALSFLAAQSAACNARHSVDERCARWLLTAQDRVRGDTLSLTHEFIGTMLGVRRAGVTVAAGALQRAGLIRYNKGRVTILDREALESVACECYPAVNQEYARLGL